MLRIKKSMRILIKNVSKNLNLIKLMIKKTTMTILQKIYSGQTHRLYNY